MAQFLPDDIDFGAYERQTECKAKVRPASDFAQSLRAAFDSKQGNSDPKMFSTKLGSVIEFRPGEVTAWGGYNGAKKSMFLGQVVLDLCVQHQPTLVVSLEMRPGQTLARMARQAAAVRRPSGPWLDNFDRWTDGRIWLFDHMGRLSPEQCIAVCRYFADELKGAHVVIDSMMMVCKSEEHLDEQKQFVTDLVRVAQETGLHLHLVTHCRKPQNGEDKPPTKYEMRGSAAISDQVANVVTMWWNKPKYTALAAKPHDLEPLGLPDYAVTVEKQREGEFEGRLQLWFHAESLRFCNDRVTIVEPYPLVVA